MGCNMNDDEAKRIAKRPGIVLKFAGLLPDGRLTPDAHDDYEGLFEGLPSEWAMATTTVEPLTDTWPHDAWTFAYKHGEAEVLAVKHETGIEFLVMGVAAPLVADALVSLAKWTWSRWNTRRAQQPQKVQSSIFIEKTTVRETFPDGRIREQENVRWLLAPPVTDSDLTAIIQKAATQN